MKNKIYIVALSTLMLVACEKDLQQKPISEASTETFYAIPEDFVKATNAVYSNLRTYPDRLLNLSETRSDNLNATSDGGVRDWEGINGFHKNLSSNPYLEEAWGTNYNGIYKANVLLEQLEKNGTTVISDETLRNRLTAETRFLRAFFYFDLVRTFGKVPLIDKVVTANEALNISRSPVSDVYGLIISDLEFAIDNLPPDYLSTPANKGRATKYAAMGMLGLVYMTRSGPTYDIEGPGLASNEWNKAYTLLNSIVTDNKYSLITSSYADIFSFTNENNAEVIFDVQYNTGANPVTGGTFPWLLAPDAWFQALGLGTQGGLTIRPVSEDLLNTYQAGDVRKGFSIQSGFTAPGGAVESRSFERKWVDLTKVPANRVDWPINFIALRYTDVLMLRAECVLNGGGGDVATEVLVPVNQIRARAGLTTPLVSLTIPQLMEERRREFINEGTRWHDLVRSGLVTTVIPAWIAAEDTADKIEDFNKNYIIYPVPFNQINLKPGLYSQNEGYN